MKQLFLLAGVLAGVGVETMGMVPKKEKKMPNVVFILADDLGYGDLSCYGQKKFQTPNIDRLALNGLRFTQCYSGTTVSAPSRACLMTGLHSGHVPIRGNKEVQPEGQMALPSGLTTLFQLFKQAGYTTGCFGKWGLGAPESVGAPNHQGVDQFFGFNCQLLAHNYYADHLWENEQRVDLLENADGKYGVYTQDLIHERGLQFVEKHRDQSFFLFLPYVLPHAELLVPEDSIIQQFRGKFPEKAFHGCDSGPYFRKGGYCSQKSPRATFAAMVYRLDVYVGQIVEKLKELGIYENTLFIFCSDNGPHQEGGADPDFFNSNGIYRGYKRDLYEGGIRVPFIVSWPGVIRSRESDLICSFWDILPTFAQLTDVSLKERLDGISLLPLWMAKGKQQKHDYLYFEFHEEGGRQAVRKGNWKLVRLNVSMGNDQIKTELYNLDIDPSEQHDLSKELPKKVEELLKIIRKEHEFDVHWPLLYEEKIVKS